MTYFRLRGKNNLIYMLSRVAHMLPDQPVNEVIRIGFRSVRDLYYWQTEQAARVFWCLGRHSR